MATICYSFPDTNFSIPRSLFSFIFILFFFVFVLLLSVFLRQMRFDWVNTYGFFFSSRKNRNFRHLLTCHHSAVQEREWKRCVLEGQLNAMLRSPETLARWRQNRTKGKIPIAPFPYRCHSSPSHVSSSCELSWSFFRSWITSGSHCLVRTRLPSSSFKPLPGPVWWSLIISASMWSSLKSACLFERALMVARRMGLSKLTFPSLQCFLCAAMPDMLHSPRRT